jgi:hypothetical protein
MSLRTLLPALAVVGLSVVPATPAVADQAIAELGRQAPVAASGGWAAWSTFDEASERYALTLRDPSGAVKAAPLAPASRPWDVSLGPDAHGDVVAVYRSCDASGCDVRRLNVATGRDQALRTVSSPSYDEATPAIWRSTVVFTRHVGRCDVPYVKDLRSSRPSRRLLKSKCLTTPAGQAAIRGSRIVISSMDLSHADSNGAGRKTSELRLYSSRVSGSKVIDQQTFGEESNLFGQVALDARYAYTLHYGVHPASSFVRVPLSGGAPEEVRTFRTVTGAFAKPSANSSLYVELQGGEEAAGCDGFTDVPCRVVYTPSSPWLGERTLTPEAQVAYTGQPRLGQPLTFVGGVFQQTVAGNSIVRTTPLAGISVELYRRVGANPERFEPTGARGVTNADAHFDIVLPAVGPHPWYTAVAATPGIATWAGRGTVGSTAP